MRMCFLVLCEWANQIWLQYEHINFHPSTALSMRNIRLYTLPLKVEICFIYSVNRTSQVIANIYMMMSSNGNIFCVTGPLCGEFTGHWWIPPPKGQWWEALIFSLICARINGWVNNREPCDLRCHHAHYDVIVMVIIKLIKLSCECVKP